MKKITIILITVITLGSMVNETKAQGYGGISFTTFYNELSPYGRWVMDPQYGQVWIADAPGFEPYYDNGRWVYTSYGWTWASDYPWGWAPFHYGRWTYLPMWGWAWVPGYQWGPAWVGWCQNDGYFGWAPLSPGMGFNFSYNSMPYNYWRFVPQQYITGPSFHNHIIRPVREQNEFRKMSIINNIQENNQVTYLAGPRREAVERVTRERITARPVAFTGTDERTRVNNKEVRMYRPDLKPNNTAGTNHPADQRRDELQQNHQPTVSNQNTAVKPLPNATIATSPATSVKPGGNQTVEPITSRDERAVKPLPVAPKQDNQTAMDEQRVSHQLNERQVTREEMEKNRSLRTAPPQQDDQRLQRVQEQLQREQQMQAQQRVQQQNELQSQRAQQEQLRQQQVQEQRLQQQQALQQQNEQRQNEMRQQQLQAQKEQQLREQQQQNEIRRQQLQEQRMQQRMMQQQQNQQRQNEIRQQQMQGAPMRPQREMPVNQRPRSGKPNEN